MTCSLGYPENEKNKYQTLNPKARFLYTYAYTHIFRIPKRTPSECWTCQKRPTTVSKETYYSVKRELLQNTQENTQRVLNREDWRRRAGLASLYVPSPFLFFVVSLLDWRRRAGLALYVPSLLLFFPCQIGAKERVLPSYMSSLPFFSFFLIRWCSKRLSCYRVGPIATVVGLFWHCNRSFLTL